MELIDLLVSMWPESIQVKNDYGWTPLHCAAFHAATTSVVEYLAKAYPAALMEAAYQSGDYPMHLLCSGATPIDCVKCLLKLIRQKNNMDRAWTMCAENQFLTNIGGFTGSSDDCDI